VEVLGWKERSGISLVMAAEVTGVVSYRQAKRIWERYRTKKSMETGGFIF
jgi:hypothetical protein